MVRSAGGLVPFYVAGEGERWTVATTLAHLLRFHPEELGLDPLVNAIWTSGYDAAPDRRTFVAGVQGAGARRVRPAGRRAPGVRPLVGPAPGRDAATVAPITPSGCARRSSGPWSASWIPTGENLLALSGGVDSSAVGALAAGTAGARGQHPDRALRRRGGASPGSPATSTRSTEAVGFRRRRMVTVDRERRLELLDEPRVPFHVLQPYLCLLPSVASEWPVSVLVGGEFADHTVGSTLTLRDWARHTTLRGLWRARRALPTGPSRHPSLVRLPPAARAAAPAGAVAGGAAGRSCGPSFAPSIESGCASAGARPHATTGRCPTWRCSSSARGSSACTGR